MAPPPPFQFVDEDDQINTDHTPTNHGTSSLYGRIMLAAVVSLVVVVFIVILVRIFERCVRRREARALTQELSLAGPVPPPLRGLDPLFIASLPIFAYKQTNSSGTDCAVCLSLLEDQEMARVLPNCRHTFHAECIDKWLGSRSTYPICRTDAAPRLPRPMPRDRPIASPDDHHHATIVSQVNPTVASESCDKEAGGSSSRLNSFRRMLSLNRSSTGRVQVEVQDVVSEDLDTSTIEVSDIYSLYG